MQQNKISLSFFLLYLLFITIGSSFISKSFYFIAYDISSSVSLVSIVGSVSATAFLLTGCFAGIIVDAYSRKFFIYFEVFFLSILSTIILFLYTYNALSIILFFGYVLILNIVNTFSQASRNSIYFDIWGEKNLSRSISCRSITLTLASIISSLLLAYFIVDEKLFLIIYIICLLLSIIFFKLARYEDQNSKEEFSNLSALLLFIKNKFCLFFIYCIGNKTIIFLFIFSFIKTILIYWTMTSGSLLKFGIDEDYGKKLFVIVLGIMDVVTIVSTLILGKTIKSFTLYHFIIGMIICGISTLLFSLSNSDIIKGVTLSLLYIGLSISQLASGYITRLEFDNSFRTQGLAFSVIPYYTADIISGLIYAYLIHLFTLNNILFYTGVLLVGCGIVFMSIVKWSRFFTIGFKRVISIVLR